MCLYVCKCSQRVYTKLQIEETKSHQETQEARSEETSPNIKTHIAPITEILYICFVLLKKK